MYAAHASFLCEEVLWSQQIQAGRCLRTGCLCFCQDGGGHGGGENRVVQRLFRRQFHVFVLEQLHWFLVTAVGGQIVRSGGCAGAGFPSYSHRWVWAGFPEGAS